MFGALKRHWPEYLIEGTALGFFLIAACSFTVALEHPASPFRELLPDFPRRALMGLAMGATAIAIIYSPWGKRSGAHMNPAVTLTFYRLGKIETWDALGYVLAQFTGGVLGVAFAASILGALVSHPRVNYAATVPGVPGPAGIALAFAAELLMAFLMMSMILRVTNDGRLSRFAGVFGGILVFTFITIEAPVSGMSLNPARTLGSAVNAHLWTALWLYFTAPLLGMTLAAELHRTPVRCAKLHHDNSERCIFRCGFTSRGVLSTTASGSAARGGYGAPGAPGAAAP
jgi:aquaporin Z